MDIVSKVVESGSDSVKLGDKHPYYQTLFKDRTIDKLFRIFKQNEKKEEVVKVNTRGKSKANDIEPDEV